MTEHQSYLPLRDTATKEYSPHLVVYAWVVDVLTLGAEDFDCAGAWQVTGAHRQAGLAITQHPAGVDAVQGAMATCGNTQGKVH